MTRHRVGDTVVFLKNVDRTILGSYGTVEAIDEEGVLSVRYWCPRICDFTKSKVHTSFVAIVNPLTLSIHGA